MTTSGSTVSELVTRPMHVLPYMFHLFGTRRNMSSEKLHRALFSAKAAVTSANSTANFGVDRTCSSMETASRAARHVGFRTRWVKAILAFDGERSSGKPNVPKVRTCRWWCSLYPTRMSMMNIHMHNKYIQFHDGCFINSRP